MTFPPRLHVLFASQTREAVVLRRGPSHHIATVAWDRERDRFTLGQWMKGRIYERRSDLSPDGKHLLYFAMNGHWSSASRGSWTAISRAPYLRATGFFTKGDCWHGGGHFLATEHKGKSRYWLNDGYGHRVVRQTTEVTREPTYRPSPSFGGECPGVYYHRLMRDGWSYLKHDEGVKWKGVDVFEKPLEHGFRLRKLAHCVTRPPPGKGCYWDEHVVIAPDGTERREPDWEWAELDGTRLVFAKDGVLWASRFDRRGALAEPEPLFDFNPMKFEAIEAPYR